MSKVKEQREILNLTQQELAEKTQLSIRTIQRIEAGQEPKGHTLKVLATALAVAPQALSVVKAPEAQHETVHKWINLSALPFTFFPPLNVLVPLIIMLSTKTFNAITKQIITLQILWTIVTVIVVISSAMIRNAYFLSDTIPSATLGLLMVLNLYIILRNAIEIARRQKLRIALKFNII